MERTFVQKGEYMVLVAKKTAGALGRAVSPPAGFGAEPQEIFEFRPSKTPKSFNLGLI